MPGDPETRSVNHPDLMANDQFPPMVARAHGALSSDVQAGRRRHWPLVIGIWSFPRLVATAFANNPGEGERLRRS